MLIRRTGAAAAALATMVAGIGLVSTGPAGADAGPDVAVKAPEGSSVYSTMPDDPTAVVLGSEDFPVHADGQGDDTAAIQAAVNEASRRGGENWLGNIVGGARGVNVGDGGGIVFVPEGTYRVTERINVPASVRVIGFGAERPDFYVAPGTFTDELDYVFAATRRPYAPDGTITFGNNDTFGTGLINLDVRVADGNPSAVGVRFGGAQMFLLQDVDIDMGDGYAAIDHNANLIQRVNIHGGQVGMLAYAASPGWQTTIIDSTFTGQQDAAIQLHTDAKLSIIRTRFASSARGIEVASTRQTQRLYVQDSIFTDITGPVITLNDTSSVLDPEEPDLVAAQNQLNIVNTGVVRSGALLRTQPSGDTWTYPADAYLVRDSTLGLRVSDALGENEQHSTEVVVDARPRGAASLHRLLTSDIPLPPDSHSWVNIAEYAEQQGITIGSGTADDHDVFQEALDRYDTVYVPMGEYLLSDTLELRPRNNLIGLHPRQTWLRIPDESPLFADGDHPRAIIHTPSGGRNFVAGLGLDTAQTNPGAAQVHWQSGSRSHLSDIATQFVKWAPEQTEPGDPTLGDPGYEFRGAYKYNFWVDGGGGTFINLWAVAGYAENGFLVEDTRVRGRVYEVSVEHHRHREVVLRDVRGWELHALQTEDHIYGWESQAVELDNVHDVLFGNTVFFRVATVKGPYPYAVGITDSSNVVLRGTRGYRPTNVDNTRWGATIADLRTGRTIPDLDVAYLAVDSPGREVRSTGVSTTSVGPQPTLMPGTSTTFDVELTNDEPAPLTRVTAAASADGLAASVDVPARLGGREAITVPVTVTVPSDLELGSAIEVSLTITFKHRGERHSIDHVSTLSVGGQNVALGSDITASSVLSSNVAAHAVDGQTIGARWISATGDPLPTLTIELGQPATLTYARVFSGVSGSASLRVVSLELEGLVDGQWTRLGQVDENSESPVMVPLTGHTAVRTVRVRFPEPSPTDGLARVFEVQLFGTT